MIDPVARDTTEHLKEVEEYESLKDEVQQRLGRLSFSERVELIEDALSYQSFKNLAARFIVSYHLAQSGRGEIDSIEESAFANAGEMFNRTEEYYFDHFRDEIGKEGRDY